AAFKRGPPHRLSYRGISSEPAPFQMRGASKASQEGALARAVRCPLTKNGSDESRKRHPTARSSSRAFPRKGLAADGADHPEARGPAWGRAILRRLRPPGARVRKRPSKGGSTRRRRAWSADQSIEAGHPCPGPSSS